MAGPWEQYQDQSALKPWERYAQQTQPEPAALESGRSITDEATRGDTRGPIERMINQPVLDRLKRPPGESLGKPGPGAIEQDIATNQQLRQTYEASPEKRQGMSFEAYYLKNKPGFGPITSGFVGGGGEPGKMPELAPRLRTGSGATEALRTDALSRASGMTASEDRAAAAAERRAGAAQSAQEQIATRQPHIAEARAAQRLQASPLHAQRQKVLADLREKVRALQRSHQEAGMNVGDAQRQVALAERKVQDSEQAVSHLEAELLQRKLHGPPMTVDEYGTKLRAITQQIHDKYSKIRSQQSGFRESIENAGDAPRVNTQPTQALIDQHLKDIRNPSLERALTIIREKLETQGQPRLTVRSADSLRGYLDSILRSKMMGELKVDRETLFIVKQIKKALVESATQAWQPYRDALAKWRTLSRPLDIVERKGALRKVIDTDPLSTDYALTEAQVVGHVLKGAGAGNPTLTRLIAENPALKDAARLHFTQDLFVRETVRTIPEMRTWLKNNERALKQAGLYDEFRDIRVARETAGKAVQEAKGVRAGSIEQLRAAEKAEAGAAEQLRSAEKLRQKQQARIEAEERAAESGGTDRRVISTRKVQTARQKLAAKQAEAQTEGAKRKKVADAYRQFESEIKVARPEQVPAQARGLIKRLRDDGRLNTTQYEELLTRVQHAEDKIASRAERMKRIKQIVRYAALGALGYEVGREGVSAITGR